MFRCVLDGKIINNEGENCCLGVVFPEAWSVLDWNYTAGHVELSMPKYVARALHKFKQALQKFHPNGFNKPEYSPQKKVEPNYGRKVQYAEPNDD